MAQTIIMRGAHALTDPRLGRGGIIPRGAVAMAGGDAVTRQLDRIWTKYTGNPPPYGLRDPAIDEKRVLFVCRIDRIATFGKP